MVLLKQEQDKTDMRPAQHTPLIYRRGLLVYISMHGPHRPRGPSPPRPSIACPPASNVNNRHKQQKNTRSRARPPEAPSRGAHVRARLGLRIRHAVFGHAKPFRDTLAVRVRLSSGCGAADLPPAALNTVHSPLHSQASRRNAPYILSYTRSVERCGPVRC